MNEHQWRFEISVEGETYSIHWNEAFGPNETPSGEYFLECRDSTGQELKHQSRLLRHAITDAAGAFRRTFVREEFKNKLGLIEHKPAILELFRRAQAGEYLGQASNGGLLYAQDVAAILDISLWGEDYSAYAFVQQLIEEEKIGLHGMILIPYDDYAEAFAYHEKKTGHKQLTQGDWGNWSCAFCGKNGDEYTDPKNTPCSVEESQKRSEREN